MKMTFTLTGGKELADNLATLAQPMQKKILIEGLLAAATPLQSVAAQLAPRSPFPGPHLGDHIVKMVMPARDLERVTDVSVAVGPERRPDYIFWGYFQEFGTARAAAQPFMRPAFEQTAIRILDALLTWLWYLVKNQIPEASIRIGPTKVQR